MPFSPLSRFYQCICIGLAFSPAAWGQEFKLAVHNNGKVYAVTCLTGVRLPLRADFEVTAAITTDPAVLALPESSGDRAEKAGEKTAVLQILDWDQTNSAVREELLSTREQRTYLLVGSAENVPGEARAWLERTAATVFLLDKKYLPEVAAMLPGMVCISAKSTIAEPDSPAIPALTAGEVKKNTLRVFPNPARSILFIELITGSDEPVDGQLLLLTSTGQVAARQSAPLAGTYPVDIAHLPSGSYTLTCSGCETEALPVIIQHNN